MQDFDGNLHQQAVADKPPMLIPIQPEQDPVVPMVNPEILLPPVEEVIQALAAAEPETPPQVEVQVLEMDGNTDASEDGFQLPPPPAPVVPVEIPNFPNLQNLPHFQVEDVPLAPHCF